MAASLSIGSNKKTKKTERAAKPLAVRVYDTNILSALEHLGTCFRFRSLAFQSAG